MNAFVPTPVPLINATDSRRDRLFESPAPAATSTESPTGMAACHACLDEKLQAAKSYLGRHWLLHPAYVFTPRHSFLAATWRSATGVLDEIITRAYLAGRL